MQRVYSLMTLLTVFCSVNHLSAQEIYCSKYKTVTPENQLGIEDFRSDTIDILSTEIFLNFQQMSTGDVIGNSVLTIEPKVDEVTEMVLDFEGLTVDSITGVAGTSFNHLGSKLLLSFASPLANNQTYQVNIHYHGKPIKDATGWGGFYFQGGFAWNLGVGFASDPHSYGRIWFPCFDNFIERSTYEFHITTPEGKVAACNGLLVDSTLNQGGVNQFHWILEDPIPSYLVCVAIGNYEVLESSINGANGSIPVQLFARSGDTADLSASFIHLHDAVLAFEEAYGPYQFSKVGYSLVPFNAGAMEHATNITYPIYAADGGLSQESLMSHELAHMWWGDAVTCQTDGDMWINEGWASFSEFLFEEAVYGREAYEQAMLVDLKYMLQYGHHYEEEYRPVAGQPHDLVYGDHVYKKGALVAHNLRGYMGDEAFFAAINDFMDAYRFQPVSSDSIERYFSMHSGQDLSYFFRDWVFNGGYNVLVLDSFRSKESGTVTMFVQQKLKGADQFYDETVGHYTVYDENWNKQSGTFEMSGQYADIEISTNLDPVWIVLNESNQIASASTADQVVVKSTGEVDLAHSYWDLTVNNLNGDSALLRVNQIWSYPDPIKAYEEKAYKMNDYRYWIVSGLNLDQLEMEASFFYDGRNTGAGGSGYLDMSLLAETEDSLILLYRENSYTDWSEYEHYVKNMLGTTDDGLGIMELDRVLEGEYVLANIDHTVLDIENLDNGNGYRLFPNPTDGILILEQESEGVGQIRLYDLKGGLVRQQDIDSRRTTLDISGNPNGCYIYELLTFSGALAERGRIVLGR